MNINNKDSLKTAVTTHFEKFELSDEQLEQLSKVSRAGPKVIDRRTFYRKIAVGAGAAATLFLVYTLTLPSATSTVAIETLAGEISYNHNKRLQLEYVDTDLEALQKNMSKLDFSLVVPALLNSSSWTLLGARYCSVNGHVAAQMRYLNRDENREYTLYQSLFPPDVSGFSFSGFDAGNKVTIWKEKGLFIGLVGAE